MWKNSTKQISICERETRQIHQGSYIVMVETGLERD
jgi:hypothetical protein